MVWDLTVIFVLKRLPSGWRLSLQKYEGGVGR